MRSSRARPWGWSLPPCSTGTRSTRRVPFSATATWLRSSTGRCVSTTTSVGPRTALSQAPNSPALDTVADKHTNTTAGSVRMMTSSHTEPR